MTATEPPEWTDHDVSDPGITLVQALVWSIAAAVVVAVVARRRRRRRARAASTPIPA